MKLNSFLTFIPLLFLSKKVSLIPLVDEVHPEENKKFSLKDFQQQYFKIQKKKIGMYPIDIGLTSKSNKEVKELKDLWIVGYGDLNSDSK